MRISSLFVDGFGMFHNLSLEDLPGGFILFSGDNEAGKSTCLWFIRDMLFGFRDRRSKDNEYPPLAGRRPRRPYRLRERAVRRDLFRKKGGQERRPRERSVPRRQESG